MFFVASFSPLFDRIPPRLSNYLIVANPQK
jgi:hypothetical protein